MIGLVCPDCRTALGDSDACPGCGRALPRLRGIVDLRTHEDGYLSDIDDLKLAEALDAEFDRLDFLGLLDRYFEHAAIPLRRRPGQVAHILGGEGRATAWLAILPDSGPILDLGCGSGSFLKAVGRDREVVGCDTALRWLLQARKRLDEAGLADRVLVRASAERLPWPDSTFSAVVAGDVIEHVADQGAAIDEAFRVLKPGGMLAMASPNRFSLGLEPHVGLWGVGFLPTRWMSLYVRLRGRGDFRAIHTSGLNEWRRRLERSEFGGGEVLAPKILKDDLALMSPIKHGLVGAYNCLVSTRWGQGVALRVGPLFHVVCRKPET